MTNVQNGDSVGAPSAPPPPAVQARAAEVELKVPTAVDASRLPAAAERYESLYREETGLVAQRINWLIGTQAFLVAAYIEAASPEGPEMTIAPIVIAGVGICLALLVTLSVHAAFVAQVRWLEQAKHYAGPAADEFPLVFRDKSSGVSTLMSPSLSSRTEGRARFVAYALPGVLVVLWSIFLYCRFAGIR